MNESLIPIIPSTSPLAYNSAVGNSTQIFSMPAYPCAQVVMRCAANAWIERLVCVWASEEKANNPAIPMTPMARSTATICPTREKILRPIAPRRRRFARCSSTFSSTGCDPMTAVLSRSYARVDSQLVSFDSSDSSAFFELDVVMGISIYTYRQKANANSLRKTAHHVLQ